MIRLISFLVFGYNHKWEIIDSRILTGSSGAKGSRYILQCKCCGNIKKKDLI